MQREIKFRAWDMIDKVIRDVVDLKFKSGSYYTMLLNPTQNAPENWTLRKKDEVILMQYTGLTDKNGKEIYEGYLDQDGGRVFYNESMARFQIDYGGDVDIADMEDVGEWMIVSGNIYEDKELLNS